MLKEIRNNVYHAEFVVADEEGQCYAAFEADWNGEYWEATACTESGELIKGETVKPGYGVPGRIRPIRNRWLR